MAVFPSVAPFLHLQGSSDTFTYTIRAFLYGPNILRHFRQRTSICLLLFSSIDALSFACSPRNSRGEPFNSISLSHPARSMASSV